MGERDPVNWASNSVPEPDDEPAPRKRWSRIQWTAMAICQSGIGQTDESKGCICFRDGRTPSRDVPRCSQCLNAATAASLILDLTA